MSAPVPDGLVRLQMHLNLAVRYALWFGVVLGLVQFLLSPSADRVAALQGGFQVGLLVGVVVSVVVGIPQWRAAAAARDRRLAADPDAPATVDPGVRVARTVRAPRPRTEILHRGEEWARVLDRGRLEAVDETAGTLTLSTPVSGWSWGDRVVLAVGAEEAGRTAVTVTSRPAFRGPAIDFGRNARNVERIAAALADADADGPAGPG